MASSSEPGTFPLAPSVARSLTRRAEAEATAAGKLPAPWDGPGSIRMTAALANVLILPETHERLSSEPEPSS